MKALKKTTASLIAAGAVVTIFWMAARLVSAIAFLLTPMTDAASTYPPAVTTEADASLEAGLPLFLLDNGAVAVSDSSGYVAIWDAFHARFAGLWAAASEAATSLAVIVVVIAVLLLCIRLLRGVPFTTTMTRWVGGSGAALIVGGVLAQLFSWLSRQEMVATVAATVADNGWRMPSSAFPIDPVPLASGAVLLLVALAFSAGTRMQRDTEGLV